MRVKLAHLEELTEERRRLAEEYLKGIRNEKIILPQKRDKCGHVWHQFVIRCERRDELIKHMEQNGIGTIIHYPIPPHLSEAYEYLGFKEGDYPRTEEYAKTILSLPMYNGMTKEELERVIRVLNEF